MTGRITYHRRVGEDGGWEAVAEYYVDGVAVGEAEFLAAFPDQAAVSAGAANAHPGNWPLASVALAVHQKQIPAAVASARAKGVPTEFTATGEPVFTDRGHRKRYLKAYGFHDNRGGYGD